MTMSKIQGEYFSQNSKQLEMIAPIQERREEFEGTIFLTNGSVESRHGLQERMKEFIAQIDNEDKRSTLTSSASRRKDHFALVPQRDQ